MDDLSADDRALLARYWPQALEEAAADPTHWTDHPPFMRHLLDEARAMAAREVAEAVAADRRKKVGPWAPAEVTAGIDAATVDITAARDAVEDARWTLVPGQHLLPDPTDKRPRDRRIGFIIMALAAVALLCCGAAASESLRWLTEGIQ